MYGLKIWNIGLFYMLILFHICPEVYVKTDFRFTIYKFDHTLDGLYILLYMKVAERSLLFNSIF